MIIYGMGLFDGMLEIFPQTKTSKDLETTIYGTYFFLPRTTFLVPDEMALSIIQSSVCIFLKL